MKKILTLVLVFAMASACSEAKEKKTKKGSTSEVMDSVSYALGMQMAENLKQNDIIESIVTESFAMALEDIKTDKPALTQDQAQQVVSAFFTKKFEDVKQNNLKKGQDFLAENAKKSGVKTTESGLQYEILQQGNTKNPKATDEVEVNYEGKLLDGTVFDSSYKRGEPITFPLNQVIGGWTEGVQLIGEGGKIRLFIPSHLAYGENGTGQNGPIGPNEALIFEIELLSIK